jgi:hypothetical protein
MSVDFPSEVSLCQRISAAIAQITFAQSAIGGLFSGVSVTNYLRSEGDPIEEALRVPLYHASSVENHFIGLVGFEPTASWSRTRRSTKLSHSPKSIVNLACQASASLTSRVLSQMARSSM